MLFRLVLHAYDRDIDYYQTQVNNETSYLVLSRISNKIIYRMILAIVNINAILSRIK